MQPITFDYLAKDTFPPYAPTLFSILHENMSSIAPTGNTYEEDFSWWCRAFGGAFTGRTERQIVLIRDASQKVVGFFGYCALNGTFHMEEIQLLPAFQGTRGIFRSLYRFVTQQLPEDTHSVEAYADTRNAKSIAILARLGLKLDGTNEAGSCYRFRGAYSDLLQWLNAAP